MAKKKQRLDQLVVERGLLPTRAKAKAYIMAGEVLVNGEKVTKAGTPIPIEATIELVKMMPYVGRGGYKLAGALDAFELDVAGLVCADVGACTGGFTDVLLQRGASKVYAIDVGYGQLDWKLRNDERVVVMERTNARYVEILPQPIDLAVIDVSFISLKLILPAVKQWLASSFNIVALIKPQFEAGRDQVGKGGIVRDQRIHRSVLTDILTWCEQQNLHPNNLIRSPIVGSEGNVEFLVQLGAEQFTEFHLDSAINSVLANSIKA